MGTRMVSAYQSLPDGSALLWERRLPVEATSAVWQLLWDEILGGGFNEKLVPAISAIFLLCWKLRGRLELGLLLSASLPSSPALASFETFSPPFVGVRLQPHYSSTFHSPGFSWYESQAIWAGFCLTSFQTAPCQLSSSSQAVQSAQLLLQTGKHKHGLTSGTKWCLVVPLPCSLPLLSHRLVAGRPSG